MGLTEDLWGPLEAVFNGMNFRGTKVEGVVR